MALNKSIITNSGVSLVNTYIRIDTVSGCKNNILLTVNSYVSQETFNEGKAYLEQKFYAFTPSIADGSENFIKQGYNYLKTLDEYTGATDC